MAEGKSAPVEIPRPTAMDNRMTLRETMHVRPPAQAVDLRVEIEAAGLRADALRAVADASGMAGVREFLTRFMVSTRPDIDIPEDPDWTDDRAANTMTLKFASRVPEGVRPDPKYARDALGIAPFSMLGLLPLPENVRRTSPVFLGDPMRIEHHVEVAHPRLTTFKQPLRVAEHASFRLWTRFGFAEGRAKASFELEITGARVEPSDTATYQLKVRRAFELLDLSLNLPPATRGRPNSGDPEHQWGGGIPSPAVERHEQSRDQAKIVMFMVGLLIFLIVMIRLLWPFVF